MIKLNPKCLMGSLCISVVLFTVHSTAYFLYCSNECSKPFVCKSINLNFSIQSLFLLICLPTIGVYFHKITPNEKETAFIITSLYCMLLNGLWSIAFVIGFIQIGNNIVHICAFLYISVSLYFLLSFCGLMLWVYLRRRIYLKETNEYFKLKENEIYTINLCDI
ncbi:unnamed protein product [Phyllotreta striolata]|uniref:Uncharacterized protein n=1 Tax=Phyllotreta striolata TaxID=444603 RepID=A0A9N9XRQ4_PHYSR|nr:unnamed protein product [Phyllotreta striolata]